jgi:hypothetical protein
MFLRMRTLGVCARSRISASVVIFFLLLGTLPLRLLWEIWSAWSSSKHLHVGDCQKVDILELDDAEQERTGLGDVVLLSKCSLTSVDFSYSSLAILGEQSEERTACVDVTKHAMLCDSPANDPLFVVARQSTLYAILSMALFKSLSCFSSILYLPGFDMLMDRFHNGVPSQPQASHLLPKACLLPWLKSGNNSNFRFCFLCGFQAQSKPNQT